MRNILFALLFVGLVVLLLGCTQTNSELEDGVVDDLVVATGELKEFNVTAKQFEFVPSQIKVNEGDTVKITLTSIDVPHGFFISEFGVSETIGAGEIKTFEFVASKKGSYDIICHVYCGQGHSNMQGFLVVE